MAGVALRSIQSRKMSEALQSEQNGVVDTLRKVIEVDRLVHDPVRYALMAYLHVVARADFTFLLRQLEVSRGNLSSHMSKLEEAGYVAVDKSFVDNRPRTMYSVTKEGRSAFKDYRTRMMQAIDLPT